MKSRVFDFDPGTTTDEALPVIRQALEDEGLALAPAYSHGKIVSVMVNGRALFKVPGERIVDPERAAELAVVAKEYYERVRAERDARMAGAPGGAT